MNEDDALLWPIFQELRNLGVPIGIPEYLLALKTLKQGIGLENVHDLKQVCSLLWVKSQEDLEIFSLLFNQMVKKRLLRQESLFDKAEENAVSSSRTTPPVRPRQDTDPETKPVTGRSDIQRRHSFHTTPLDTEIDNIPFTHQSIDYSFTPHLPLGRREMTGLWRHLRQLQRKGSPVDLDIDATIDAVCKTGVFLGPVRVPRRLNQIRLILLIDQLGSMVPFSLLLDALIESTGRSGLLGSTDIYYFHDCPDRVVYRKPNLIDPVPLHEALAEYTQNCVLVVSDAGAARGYYDQVRVDDTYTFIHSINTYTYLYAWLNPMPDTRWLSTTAQEIATMMPMFYLDREGLNDAIDILRGHPFPLEVHING